MTDLDFDEIDRAVNSASNGSSKPAEPPVEAKPEQPREPTVNRPTLAGRRSSGQFMDVVHPSSNMRKSTLTMPERPAETKPTEPAAQPIEPTVPEEKSVEQADSGPKKEWPDPIEVSESKQVVAEEKPNEEDDDIAKISQEITEELDNKSSDSLPETPFIAGTKVEKRPLGAFSDEKDQPESEIEKKTEEPGEVEKTEPEIVPDNDEPITDELEGKLVKIESDEVSKADGAAKETIPEKSADVTPESKPSQDEHKTPIEATSINQQYQEKPSTGDKTSGAIYDTEAYHKALVHPPKKKSGWMWVVWILLLLIIGVGAGVLAYNYILPLL